MASVLEQIVKHEVETAEKLQAVESQIKSAVKQLRNDREKLYKRRGELVSGKALPTQDELQEWNESHAGSHDSTSSSIKGVPYFYLTVLCNQDTIAEEVSSRDKQALSYCTGIRATYPSKGGPATVEMSFSANPFFSNNLLKRCLGDPGVGVEEVTTDIQWKDTAHKLTVREVTKKSGGKKGKGKGGKGKGGGGSSSTEEPAAAKAKFKACASFFQFFMPDSSSSSKAAVHPAMLPFTPESDEDDEGADEGKSAKQEKDELIMALLLEEVLPKATSLYLAGPLQAPSDEDDEDSDFQVVHGPVGETAADLPPATQKVVAALQHNQAQLDALAQQWQAARSKLKAEQSKLRVALAQARRSLLLPEGADTTTVPRFWLRVLKSADAAALAISPRDAAVLACLADVRFSLNGSPSSSELQGKWELEFLPNKYLSPTEGDAAVLAKSYTFEQSTRVDRLLHSKVLAAPKWASADVDPTHKMGRDGKQRVASSIFQLFKQGGGKYAFNLAGSSKDVQDEANDLETELLQELSTHLLLEAGQVYNQKEQEGWHDDDNAAADQQAWDAAAAVEGDSEDLSDAEGSDDEGEAAHQAALKRSRQRKSWRPTKAEVLIFLVGMMLLGELFVFLDMAGLFRRR